MLLPPVEAIKCRQLTAEPTRTFFKEHPTDICPPMVYRTADNLNSHMRVEYLLVKNDHIYSLGKIPTCGDRFPQVEIVLHRWGIYPIGHKCRFKLIGGVSSPDVDSTP